jgi:hypothetical protein
MRHSTKKEVNEREVETKTTKGRIQMSNAEPIKNEEAPTGKIGFGPEGRVGGLIQFVVLTAVLTLIFVYGVSPASIVMIILPATLIMLIALGQLVLLGDCFPCAPPGGNWNPTIGRGGVGIKMTLLWAIFTAVFLLIMLYAFPKWPMSPLYLWWGALGFGTTLLYGINWNGWPFKGKVHPWVMMLIGTIVVIAVASIVWQFTNLGGTPLAGSPFDRNGPFNVNLLTGFVVWFIAWFFIFSPVFVTQAGPSASWAIRVPPLPRRSLPLSWGTSAGLEACAWGSVPPSRSGPLPRASSSGPWSIPGISSSGGLPD